MRFGDNGGPGASDSMSRKASRLLQPAVISVDLLRNVILRKAQRQPCSYRYFRPSRLCLIIVIASTFLRAGAFRPSELSLESAGSWPLLTQQLLHSADRAEEAAKEASGGDGDLGRTTTTQPSSTSVSTALASTTTTSAEEGGGGGGGKEEGEGASEPAVSTTAADDDAAAEDAARRATLAVWSFRKHKSSHKPGTTSKWEKIRSRWMKSTKIITVADRAQAATEAAVAVYQAFNKTEESMNQQNVGHVLSGFPRDKWQQLVAFEQGLYRALKNMTEGQQCLSTGVFAFYGCALHKADGAPACLCDGWLAMCHQETVEKVDSMLARNIVGEAMFLSRSMIAGRCHFRGELFFLLPLIPLVLTIIYFVMVVSLSLPAKATSGSPAADAAADEAASDVGQATSRTSGSRRSLSERRSISSDVMRPRRSL